MMIRRTIAIAAISATTLALASGAVAGAATVPPTLTSPYPIYTLSASAYSYAMSGPLNQRPSLPVNCPNPGTQTAKGSAVNIPGVGSIWAPVTGCSVDGPTLAADGVAGFAGVSLLGGALSIGAIETSCQSDASGNTTVGSTVAEINGKAVVGPTTMVIGGGLATVTTDVNSQTFNAVTDATTIQSIGVEVVIPAHFVYLLGIPIMVSPAQTIVIGECSISGTLLNNSNDG